MKIGDLVRLKKPSKREHLKGVSFIDCADYGGVGSYDIGLITEVFPVETSALNILFPKPEGKYFVVMWANGAIEPFSEGWLEVVDESG